jgi:hypothetical protein
MGIGTKPYLRDLVNSLENLTSDILKATVPCCALRASGATCRAAVAPVPSHVNFAKRPLNSLEIATKLFAAQP